MEDSDLFQIQPLTHRSKQACVTVVKILMPRKLRVLRSQEIPPINRKRLLARTPAGHEQAQVGCVDESIAIEVGCRLL